MISKPLSSLRVLASEKGAKLAFFDLCEGVAR